MKKNGGFDLRDPRGGNRFNDHPSPFTPSSSYSSPSHSISSPGSSSSPAHPRPVPFLTPYHNTRSTTRSTPPLSSSSNPPPSTHPFPHFEEFEQFFRNIVREEMNRFHEGVSEDEEESDIFQSASSSSNINHPPSSLSSSSNNIFYSHTPSPKPSKKHEKR